MNKDAYIPLSLFAKETLNKSFIIITTDLLFAQNLPGFENLEGLKVKENHS